MRKWLIKQRKDKNLSQEEVATVCGISRQYYGLIESGSRGCPVKTAKKIAQALGFRWERFFEETTETEVLT